MKTLLKCALPMTFKAVVLTIKNGSIIDAAGGRCEMDGSIKSWQRDRRQAPETGDQLMPGWLSDKARSLDRAKRRERSGSTSCQTWTRGGT